jgi:hypothetical protein
VFSPFYTVFLLLIREYVITLTVQIINTETFSFHESEAYCSALPRETVLESRGIYSVHYGALGARSSS